MPDVGGTYQRVHDWTDDAGSNIDMLPARFDSEHDSLATAMNNRLMRDGQNAPTADIPLGTFKFTNVGNASARNHFAAVGQMQDGATVHTTSGGSAGAYTLALSPAITAYSAGQEFTFKANHATTGAATLAVNGLAAKSVKKFGSAALVANDILVDDIVKVVYDGTNFQIIGRPGTGGGNPIFTTAQETKLSGIETAADVTDAANVNTAGAVMGSDFNAQTILQATSDDTPVALTVGEQTLVGRITSGNITALTAAQVRTLLNIENGADVTDAANVGSAGAGILADAETVAGLWNFTGDPTIDGVEIGFKIIPQNTQNGNYTLVLGDNGKHIYKASGGAGETFTIPANASVAFPIGTAITFVNQGGGTLSIAITTDTMTFSPDGTTGTRTLEDDGIATALKVSATAWIISGVGLT